MIREMVSIFLVRVREGSFSETGLLGVVLVSSDLHRPGNGLRTEQPVFCFLFIEQRTEVLTQGHLFYGLPFWKSPTQRSRLKGLIAPILGENFI